MSLAPHSSWRYLTNAEDCRDTKDGNGSYGYIKLDRIQDSTSYYIKAKAVNSNGYDRSEAATVKQYGRADILENGMIKGHYYYLDLKNLNYTQNYIWTSGQFGWY